MRKTGSTETVVTVIAPAAARTAPASRVSATGGGGQRHVSNANGLADANPPESDRGHGVAPVRIGAKAAFAVR